MQPVIRLQLLLILTKLEPSRFLLKNDDLVQMLMEETRTTLAEADLAVVVETVVPAAKAAVDFRRNPDVILPVDAVEMLPLRVAAKLKLRELYFLPLTIPCNINPSWTLIPSYQH